MNMLPINMAIACEVGMADAMDQVANLARRSARWNPDGTDTGEWYVTGTGRGSLVGYVAGKPAKMPVFLEIDQQYGSVHRSPEGSGAAQLLPEPGHIIGALTMTEQHSEYLQKFERKGTKSGMAPGENVTVEAVRDNAVVVWACIQGAVNTLVP